MCTLAPYLRVLPTETKDESGASQNISPTSVNFSNSGELTRGGAQGILLEGVGGGTEVNPNPKSQTPNPAP